MKTGNNITEDNEIPDEAFDMASVMTLFTKKGLQNSSCYVKHSCRPSITAEDIKRGLMIEMFLFSKRPDLLPEVQEVKKALKGDSDSDNDSDNEDYEIPQTDDNTPFSLSPCPCALCKSMNDIYIKWNTFQPSSVIEDILYRNINKVPT